MFLCGEDLSIGNSSSDNCLWSSFFCLSCLYSSCISPSLFCLSYLCSNCLCLSCYAEVASLLSFVLNILFAIDFLMILKPVNTVLGNFKTSLSVLLLIDFAVILDEYDHGFAEDLKFPFFLFSLI